MADPIILPDVGFQSCTFDPVRPRDIEQMEGRRTEGQTFGTPYWVATYKTRWLDYAPYGVMDAFVMQVGDNGGTFLGYDAFRPRPIIYDNYEPLSGQTAGGALFSGLATLQSITNNQTIVVSGLPAAWQLSPGDYIEIRKSALVRSVHRIMAAATSNAAGVVTLLIRSSLDLQTFTLPCAVNFEKPSCVMQIDPGSVSAPKGWEDRSVSFSATEVFYS